MNVNRTDIPYIANISSEENKAAANYCRYLPLSLNGTKLAGLVDSGNVWNSVISKDCYTNLGLKLKDLQPVRVREIATAKRGAFLKVLGEPRRAIKLSIDQGVTSFSFRPVVVEGLSMPVNISGPWMKAHGWDQLHSKNCIRAQGRNYALVRHQDARPAETPVYFMEDTVASPDAMTIVALDVPGVRTRMVRSGEGYLRGGEAFMEATDLHPALNAIVSCDQNGRMVAAVLNTLNEPVTVRKGQRYGTYAPTCRLKDWEDQPGGICVIEPQDINQHEAATIASADKAPTRKSKMDAYIAEFLKKAKAKSKAKKEEKPVKDPNSYTEDEKRQWLTDKFQLDKSPFLQERKNLDKAVAVLKEFWDLFSHDGSFGKTHLIKHRIITEDVPPIKCRYRPLNPALEPALREQLDTWLKHDVIEPSESPWSFNILAAKKRGGALRWCIDWRRLNDITKKDSFPMPGIQDNIARLAGSTVFSGIDMAGAFHCVELQDEDKEKTAFATPFGLFQQKRLGFGVTNGPATYCRLVERILRDIPDSVAIGFLDDGVIHSTDLESHFVNVAMTLSAYRDAGVKLNPKKCAFFQDHVIYLGHVLNKDGIRPTDSYIDSVKKWPLPKFKTDARAFLGVVNYYRSHIKDFAQIAKPWTDVTGSGDKELEKKPLAITNDMEMSFEVLKHRLTTAPVLGFPYFKGSKAGKFTLDTDYSRDQVSGILSQEQNGKEVVIAYGSKKLSKTQRNWPSTKGELWAGIYFMGKYAYYLQYGKPFRWRTDNSALKYIKTMECPSGIIERWLGTLADFPFEVEHRAGTKHVNADALSRFGYATEMAEDEHEVCAIQDSQPGLARQSRLITLSGDEMRKAQEEDEDLKLVRMWIESNSYPSKLEVKSLSTTGKVYAGRLNDIFKGKDGVLRYKCPNQVTTATKAVPCVPKKLWNDVIKVAHLTGGHMACEATGKRLARSLFFPGMATAVSNFIQTCLPCQAKTRPAGDQRHTLVSPNSGYPFARIHLDFVGPLTPSRQSQAKYILTCKDAFTKWVEAFPMRTPSAANVVKVLERDIFARYGIPEAIHTDCGSQFTAHLFKDAGELLGYQVTHTGGYNPKGNGQVERFHRDLGAILRALVRDDPAAWEAYLPQALFAMRTTVNRSTNLAPFQIMFGREASQPLDLIFGNPNETTKVIDGNDDTKVASYLRNLRARVDKTQEFARKHLAAAVTRQRRQYQQDKKAFLPGSKVWLFTPTTKPGASRKLSSYWTGPWTVCNDPINDVMLRIQPHPSWTWQKGTKVVSIDRLKAYIDGGNNEPGEDDDILMEGDEFAENVQLQNQQVPQAGQPHQQPAVPAAQAPPPPPAPPAPPPAPPLRLPAQQQRMQPQRMPPIQEEPRQDAGGAGDGAAARLRPADLPPAHMRLGPAARFQEPGDQLDEAFRPADPFQRNRGLARTPPRPFLPRTPVAATPPEAFRTPPAAFRRGGIMRTPPQPLPPQDPMDRGRQRARLTPEERRVEHRGHAATPHQSPEMQPVPPTPEGEHGGRPLRRHKPPEHFKDYVTEFSSDDEITALRAKRQRLN